MDRIEPLPSRPDTSEDQEWLSPPHLLTSPSPYLLFFCFHNSIWTRQYLLWPVPAELKAFYKYEAWAQASYSSANADSLFSAALVIGINRMQGKCHAHSWIFMRWCRLLGRLKWWLRRSKQRPPRSQGRLIRKISVFIIKICSRPAVCDVRMFSDEFLSIFFLI